MVKHIMNHTGNMFNKVFQIKELEFVIKFLLDNHRDRLFSSLVIRRKQTTRYIQKSSTHG